MGSFLAGPVGSWLRVFVASSLTLLLGDLSSDTVTLDWKAYLIGGAVSVLPIIIAYLNTADTRFGRTASE